MKTCSLAINGGRYFEGISDSGPLALYKTTRTLCPIINDCHA